MSKTKRLDKAEIIKIYGDQFRRWTQAAARDSSDGKDEIKIYDDLRGEAQNSNLRPDDWIEIFNELRNAIEGVRLLFRLGPDPLLGESNTAGERDIASSARHQVLNCLGSIAREYFRGYYLQLWQNEDLEGKIRETELLLRRLSRFPGSFGKTCITDAVSRMKDDFEAEHGILVSEQERRRKRGTVKTLRPSPTLVNTDVAVPYESVDGDQPHGSGENTEAALNKFAQSTFQAILNYGSSLPPVTDALTASMSILASGGATAVIYEIPKELNQLRIDHVQADRFFSRVKRRLTNYIVFEKPDESRKEEIEYYISELDTVAVTYVGSRLIDGMNFDHVADSLVAIERLMAGTPRSSTYIRMAAESVKRDIEDEIERQRKRLRIREQLRALDEPGPGEEEEADGAKLLAEVCPLFAKAIPETRRVAWKMMRNFTRKQWAYFTDLNKILKESSKVERAMQIERIGGIKFLRTLFGKQPTQIDSKAVKEVVMILKADVIRAQNRI